MGAVYVRGLGEAWPLESVVDEYVGSGRMPIAAAWTARNQVFLSDDKTAANPIWRWRIDGLTHELRPDEGVAEAMAQLSKWACHESPIALTIPNNFSQLEQQSVIDRCRSLEVDVTLLWSPIAAALVWLNRFESTLGNLPKLKRNLLHVHVDWGTITSTQLQLVCEHKSSSRQWLPARSRPSREDVEPGFGWSVEASSQKSHPLAMRWRQLIGARNVDNLTAGCRPDDSTILKSIQQWETAYQDPIEHIQTFKQKLIHESASYAGVVVTGDFADFAFDGEPTLSMLLDIYAPRIAQKSIVSAGRKEKSS